MAQHSGISGCYVKDWSRTCAKYRAHGRARELEAIIRYIRLALRLQKLCVAFVTGVRSLYIADSTPLHSAEEYDALDD